jgi:hypothetical protein
VAVVVVTLKTALPEVLVVAQDKLLVPRQVEPEHQGKVLLVVAKMVTMAVAAVAGLVKLAKVPLVQPNLEMVGMV